MSGHNRLADIDDINFVQEPEQIKFTQIRVNLSGYQRKYERFATE